MMSTQGKYDLELTTPGDREIVMRRSFDAPRTMVFDAFTKPELIARWLLGPDGWSMPVCEVDLRAGGTFRYVWRNDGDGREFGQHGAFREIVRPERIVHTEQFDGQPSEALTTTEFKEAGGTTTVIMTNLFESGQIRDMVIETGMESGVARSYERLAELLAERS